LINNYIEIKGAVETFRILKANPSELTWLQSRLL